MSRSSRIQFVLSWLCLCISSLARPSQGRTDRTIPPGDTPFKLCPESDSSDLFTITTLELYPNPVLMDMVFHVNAYGVFNKDIPANSTFNLTGIVSRGETHSQPRTWTLDFCHPWYLYSLEQPDVHRNYSCPPEKGPALMVLEGYTFPMEVIAGDWAWRMEAHTPTGERIYCVEMKQCLEYDDGAIENHGWCPPVKERAALTSGQQRPLSVTGPEARLAQMSASWAWLKVNILGLWSRLSSLAYEACFHHPEF